MKKLPLLTLTLALALPACSKPVVSDVSLDELLTNPLFAERYADEMVDAVVEFKIQNDPILQDAKKADVIESTRTKWLDTARTATKLQREGTAGNMINVTAYTRGEVLYLNDVLYTDTVFEVTPGPNLHLYLTTVVDPRDVEFPDESVIDIGPLQSPYGAQHYNVPPQENPLLYRTLVLWDEDLEKIWGFAQLNK